MSTLNLKQYLAKIDALLEDQYYDEAIFHSRHILSLFPKNLATYRRLGRAEIGANRWDDANTTLRRVLSFAPDDKIAHMGMSKVYQRAQKKEEALWHLERAYEQDPNNQEIIDELRDLYAAYKKVNNVRLQLTAGAVARQYTKNQLYPQAIKVLKDALKQTPQRVDLRLALARVYRESGDIVGAAEMALDVLDTLPDCLDANYIMTEVWLSEQRPSDAQRYLSAVEALDPYLAMRIAQGKPAPDDLIELPEADYKKAGQILGDQNPDWLNQLDNNKVVDLGGDWSDNPVDDPTLKLRDNDDLLNLDLGDDDLSWLDEPTSPVSDEETVIPENSRKQTGLTGMLAKFDRAIEQENISTTEQTNVDDLFSATDEDDTTSNDDEIMAWLTDVTPENMTNDKPSELPPVPYDKDDPMAWLKASGIEILDDSLSEDMLNKTKAPTQALNPDDPMAWLKASGVELSDEPDEQFTPYEKVESTTLKSSDDDPMAWLRESNIEFVDDEPLVKNFVDDDLPSDEADPMAWLKDSGIELIDDEPTTTVPTPTASTPSPTWDDDSSFLDEMLSMEELTGQTGGLASVLNQPSTTPEEDWQDTMANSNDDFPSWLSDTPPSDDDDFSFDDDETEAVSDEDTPDWLMDMKPAEQPVSADEFDFLSDDHADDEFTLSDEDTPDWLMGATTNQADTSFDPDATNISFNVAEFSDETSETDADFALAEDEDTPDWLMGVSETVEETLPQTDTDFAFALADDESPDAEDTPDWLMGMSDAENETAEEEVELDFLSDNLDDEALVTEDAPDWLMNSRPEADDSDEKALDWLAEDEAPVEEETPSWLSALSDDEPADEEQPEWIMDETETIGEFDETVPVADMALSLGDSVDASHTPAENAPDWLNALVPGLDIDFDADEDAPIEQSFADSAAVASASANFGWLTAIVESEVNQPPMTMPSASTIIKATETPTQTSTSSPTPSPRKWAFSRPPAWLNRSGAQPSIGIKPLSIGQNQPTSPSASSNIDDDFDDIDFDDDDDLPAWLRDDNDDEPDFLRDNNF